MKFNTELFWRFFNYDINIMSCTKTEAKYISEEINKIFSVDSIYDDKDIMIHIKNLMDKYLFKNETHSLEDYLETFKDLKNKGAYKKINTVFDIIFNIYVIKDESTVLNNLLLSPYIYSKEKKDLFEKIIEKKEIYLEKEKTRDDIIIPTPYFYDKGYEVPDLKGITKIQNFRQIIKYNYKNKDLINYLIENSINNIFSDPISKESILRTLFLSKETMKNLTSDNIKMIKDFFNQTTEIYKTIKKKAYPLLTSEEAKIRNSYERIKKLNVLFYKYMPIVNLKDLSGKIDYKTFLSQLSLEEDNTKKNNLMFKNMDLENKIDIKELSSRKSSSSFGLNKILEAIITDKSSNFNKKPNSIFLNKLYDFISKNTITITCENNKIFDFMVKQLNIDNELIDTELKVLLSTTASKEEIRDYFISIIEGAKENLYLDKQRFLLFFSNINSMKVLWEHYPILFQDIKNIKIDKTYYTYFDYNKKELSNLEENKINRNFILDYFNMEFKINPDNNDIDNNDKLTEHIFRTTVRNDFLIEKFTNINTDIFFKISEDNTLDKETLSIENILFRTEMTNIIDNTSFCFSKNKSLEGINHSLDGKINLSELKFKEKINFNF